MKMKAKKFLSWTDAIISLKTDNIKIHAENNVLQMISINGTIDVACKITDIEETSKLSAILSTEKLSNNLKAVAGKDGDIYINNDPNNSVIASGTGSIVLQTIEGNKNSFKKIPKESFAISLLATDLIYAITAVTNSLIANKNNVLRFIKMSYENENFTMTSFNGTLMSLANLPLEDVGDIDCFSYLIDGNELKSILSLLKMVSNSIIDIFIFEEEGNKYICFSSDSLKIVLKLNSEEFIPCEKLLNEKFNKSITLNVKKLIKSLISASKVVSSNVNLASDGTNAFLKDSSIGFESPIETVKNSEIDIKIPIKLLKSLTETIPEENVKIGKSEKGLIKISTDTSNNITFITTESK